MQGPDHRAASTPLFYFRLKTHIPSPSRFLSSLQTLSNSKKTLGFRSSWTPDTEIVPFFRQVKSYYSKLDKSVN